MVQWQGEQGELIPCRCRKGPSYDGPHSHNNFQRSETETPDNGTDYNLPLKEKGALISMVQG